MNSLYDNENNYRINESGTQLDDNTRKLVEALFDEWVHVRGFSPREVSQIMQGSIHELELTTAEQEYRIKTRKVVVASRALKKGEVASPETLTLKRVSAVVPSSFSRIEEVAGRRLATDVGQNQPIVEDMLL